MRVVQKQNHKSKEKLKKKPLKKKNKSKKVEEINMVMGVDIMIMMIVVEAIVVMTTAKVNVVMIVNNPYNIRQKILVKMTKKIEEAKDRNVLDVKKKLNVKFKKQKLNHQMMMKWAPNYLRILLNIVCLWIEKTVQKKVEEKKPNLELYQKLKERNGKQGDQILSSLFSKVFEQDLELLEKHLTVYLELLHVQKLLANKDFSKGLSRFTEKIAEVALDVPQVHIYLFNHVIKPLREKAIISYKFVTWRIDPKEKEKEKKADDEEEF